MGYGGLELGGCAEGGLEEGGEVVLAEGEDAAFLGVAAEEDGDFGDLAGCADSGGVGDLCDVVAGGSEAEHGVFFDAFYRSCIGCAGTAQNLGV